MEKRKLVKLVSLFVERTTQSVPMGVACLAAAVKSDPLLSAKFEPIILEGLIGETTETLAQKILDDDPVLVGFSLFVWNADKALKTARLVARKKPGITLIAGGPQATALPQEILALDIFDFVITGEGESGFVDLLKSFDLSAKTGKEPSRDIAGVWSASHLPQIGNCLAIDPARLPSPWLTDCLSVKEYSGLLWEMARGCPFKCAFCYESRGPGAVRKIPLSRLSQELDYLIREKAELINILDPTFNAEPKRAIEILKMLRKKAPGIRFTFEVRSEFLDEEQAQLFSQLHCSVQIGVQTTTPDALRNIGRTFNEKMFREKISLMNDAGAVFGFDLIYGLPGDTPEGFRKSLDFCLLLQPNHMDIFPLNVLPGTVLWDTAGELGLVYEKSAPYRALSSPGFSQAERKQAAQTHRACDLFYTQGRSVAWFLIIIRALKIKPSVFLDAFYSWADEHGILPDEIEPDSIKIEALQLAFVKHMFGKSGLSPYYAAAEDLIRFHGAYGRANIEGKTATVVLNYHPDQILSPAVLNLKAFCGSYKPRRSTLGIKVTKQGIEVTQIKEAR